MPIKKFGKQQAQHGGRPVSANNVVALQRASEVQTSGKSPLDVMFANMTFWHIDARWLIDMLVEAAAFADTANQPTLVRMLEGLNPRQMAQSCALDAARYCHPRLQSISPKSDSPMDVVVSTIIP